jgi:hypothetical protein
MAVPSSISQHDLGVMLNNPGFTSSELESESESVENSPPVTRAPPRPTKATVHIVGTTEFYIMANANLHFAIAEQKVGQEKTCTIRKKEQLVRILCIGGMYFHV